MKLTAKSLRVLEQIRVLEKKRTGSQTVAAEANLPLPASIPPQYRPAPQGTSRNRVVRNPVVISLCGQGRVAPAERLFLLGRLFLIGRTISTVRSLFLFLLAKDQADDTSLGDSKRAVPFDPLFIGLHLFNSLGAR